MTINRPAYVSEEELVSQLQSVLRSVTAEPDWRTAEGRVLEARSLVEELAVRIYNEPDRWGISDIPPSFRDDVAMDAITALLFAVPEFRARQNVTEWFSKTAGTRFRRMLALAERQKSQRERVALAAAANPNREAHAPDGEDDSPALFDLPGEGWAKFEAEFPRDAFALRLRYSLRRTPEQMAAMLEAPSPRAISMRLDRARERFGIFCEQQGIPRRDISEMLAQLSEESNQ